MHPLRPTGRWEPLFELFPRKPIRRILLRATARSNPKGGKRNGGGRGMYTRSDHQCVPTPYSSTAFPQTRAAAYQFSPFVGEPGRCATACGGGEAAGGGANDVRCGRASFRDGSAKSVDVCGPVVCVDRALVTCARGAPYLLREQLCKLFPAQKQTAPTRCDSTAPDARTRSGTRPKAAFGAGGDSGAERYAPGHPGVSR